MNHPAEKIIEKLGLTPHPEGGYFRETYRSPEEIDASNLGKEYDGKRNYATCIYFLLTSEHFSALHRIKQDEIWHFYDGSPLCLHIITPSGIYTRHMVGRDLEKGETPQLVVPGGCWFAAEVTKENAYSLVGCTVSPGFDFKDFEIKTRKELISLFPGKEEIISKLTRK